VPYLTPRERSKATNILQFSRLLRQPAKKRSGSILGYTYTCLLTCQGTTWGKLIGQLMHSDNIDGVLQCPGHWPLLNSKSSDN